MVPHDAQAALTQKTLKARIIGDGGSVIAQVPSSGEDIPRGGTVDVTDSEARRLVEMKVAEYVTETAEAAEPKAPEVNGGMPDLNADGDVV